MPRAFAALHRAHLAKPSPSRTSTSISAGRSCSTATPSWPSCSTRGRGGYCYELNGAFGSLLAALGFDVTLLEARVYDDGGGDGPATEPEVGIRFDHACLLVDLDDGRPPGRRRLRGLLRRADASSVPGRRPARPER